MGIIPSSANSRLEGRLVNSLARGEGSKLNYVPAAGAKTEVGTCLGMHLMPRSAHFMPFERQRHHSLVSHKRLDSALGPGPDLNSKSYLTQFVIRIGVLYPFEY